MGEAPYSGRNAMGIRYRFEGANADNIRPDGAVFKGCAMNWRSLIPFRKDVYQSASEGEDRFFYVKDIEILIEDGAILNAPYVDVENARDAKRALAAWADRYPRG